MFYPNSRVEHSEYGPGVVIRRWRGNWYRVVFDNHAKENVPEHELQLYRDPVGSLRAGYNVKAAVTALRGNDEGL